MDRTDSEILKLLIDDSSISAPMIAKKLKRKKILLTPRAIRKHIISLQKSNVISKFTAILDDESSGREVKRIILVQFQHTSNFLKRLEEYKQYLMSAPYCIFAIRVRGDLDWIHYKCFPSKKMADFEDDIFSQTFSDIIKNYHAYDAEVRKDNFNGLVTENDVKNHLFKYADTTVIG